MKNFCFDYCAIVIYSFILGALKFRRMTRGRDNRFFLRLVVILLLTTVCDIMMDAMILWGPLTPVKEFLVYAFSYGYFILHHATNLYFLLYVYSMTRTWYKVRHFSIMIAFLAPSVVIAGLLIANLWTHSIFYVDPLLGYCRGPLLFLMYLVSSIYMVWGIVYSLKNLGIISSSKRLALIVMYAIVVAAMIVQFINAAQLVEMMALSIVMLITVFVLQRPEDLFDVELGIQNWKAYQNELRKYIITRQSVQIIMIHFTNVQAVRLFLGDSKFDEYILSSARDLRQKVGLLVKNFSLFYERNGSFYVLIDDLSSKTAYLLPSAIKSLYSEDSSTGIDVGVRLLPKICTLNYPSDLQDFEGILNFGHNFHNYMKKDELFTFADTLLHTRRFIIENDIEAILRRASTEDRFEVFYQPLYSMQKKKFVSAEALLRLSDPVYGPIAPDIFIPSLENSGLMVSVGDTILRKSFEFAQENDLKSYGIESIEVNLSVKQCLEADFVPRLEQLERLTQTSSDTISFEITETVYDEAKEALAENINRLAQKGYRFYLDDYGTGYSNMQRMIHLPFSVVKIDKSLTDKVLTPKGRSIIENTVKMLHEINLKVVAEGVEDSLTFDVLDELGVDYIQGFYFSPALSQAEFLEFVKTCNTYKDES